MGANREMNITPTSGVPKHIISFIPNMDSLSPRAISSLGGEHIFEFKNITDEGK